MQVILVMFRGDGERRSFSIVRDVTIIGRREDCDFRIPLGEISRKHCRLIKDGDTLRAEDLGSSNGTYVNGVRVQEAGLSPGDTLKVGSVVFVVQIDGVPPEEDLKPAALPAASDSAMAMQAPSHEHEMLNPTAQVEMDHAPDLGSDVSAHDGDQIAQDLEADPSTEDAGDEYDPMSVLVSDPDASSVGSMIDDDRISEDLIVELDAHEHEQQPNQNA
jgi:pSer/pThr/pTyr-binding forkhead associated (FHA) protein